MKALIAFVSVAVSAAVGLGADEPLAWPRFRGANGSGVADGQKPPVEFGPDKNIKWKVPAEIKVFFDTFQVIHKYSLPYDLFLLI